ncbi:MAG TPA: glycosyltransferase family A protein [Sedimentisphaerales bacterium]|nr:glycosyltransferase family A protein [Sedimentisphaerales bacterium]
MKTTVSVVIPAYNAAGHIKRALDSALAQTRPADEIIVVDDGSTDGTGDIVRQYADKVRCIAQENAGVSAARNAGIKAAVGEWIALLDADDEWQSEYLEGQMRILQRNPSLVWTTGNLTNCLCREDKRGPLHSERFLDEQLGQREHFDDFFAAFLKGLMGWTTTFVIRRDALIEAGLFREGEQRYEDTDMFLRIAYRHPQIGYLRRPLAVHHLDVEGSITRRYRQLDLLYAMVERHLEMSKQYGRGDDFRRCARLMLQSTMRGMLFEARSGDIRCILKRFGALISLRHRIIMRTLTIWPDATASACHAMSKLIRAAGLRKTVTARPARAGQSKTE